MKLWLDSKIQIEVQQRNCSEKVKNQTQILICRNEDFPQTKSSRASPNSEFKLLLKLTLDILSWKRDLDTD